MGRKAGGGGGEVQVTLSVDSLHLNPPAYLFPQSTHALTHAVSIHIENGRREVVGGDIEDFEFSPKPEFEGPFKVVNVPNEAALLRAWFDHMRQVRRGRGRQAPRRAGGAGRERAGSGLPGAPGAAAWLPCAPCPPPHPGGPSHPPALPPPFPAADPR